MKHALALLAAGMAAMPAFAQRVNTEPIPDLPLRNVPPVGEPAAPPPEWKFTLGGGASYAPRYEGAANDRLRFIPMLEATDGRFFASLLRGVGYNFSSDSKMEYGLRLSLGHARRQNADPHLNGMGNIPYYLEPGAYLNLRLAPFFISSAITSGIHGTHVELGTGIALPLSRADRLRAGISTNWGDSVYNQTYFGVTPAQATASGNVLTPYQARPGIKDYALSLNWAHNFDAHWFSTTAISYKRMVGSAANSPLTLRRGLPSANFLVGYRF